MFRIAACLFPLFVLPSLAADLELRFGALERMIADQMFTQEGRRYVRGRPEAKCQFAYLEKPHLGAEASRLRVDARFSGRSALDLFGRCVGLGDSFDLTLLAVPVARDGAIGLNEVQVSTPRDSFYIGRVRDALVRSFSKDFRIDVRDQARRLLEQPREAAIYQQQLDDFRLSRVRVTREALVLEVDFRLVVK
jgi:hypothetical protein